MSTTTSRLSDMMPPSVLQQLQDSFAAISGYATLIVSPEGNPYTIPCGNCKPEMELLRSAVVQAGSSSAPAYARQCEKHYYAIPIQMGGAYLGSWLICCEQELAEQELTHISCHLSAINKVMECRQQPESLPGQASLRRREEEGERALLNKLIQALERSRAQAHAFSVAVVNIDGLAYANSAYGNDFGDMLLSNTASSIRTVIRADDIIGRLQGDSFVVALPGCDKKMAEQRIWQGREKLGQLKLIGSTESFSFTFGLAENTELPDEGAEEKYIRGLLALAEQRMRENKRSMMMRFAGV